MPAPEQILLALTFADGTLGVMSFVIRGFTGTGEVQFEREPSDENITAETLKAFGHTLNPVASWRRISPGDLPQTRDYRGAWVDRDAAIAHDMPRAREIHRTKLRAARAVRLNELDIAYRRADEDNDAQTKAQIIAERRRLRDITDDPRISQATTIEALAAITIEPPGPRGG